jgi:hypothetical protein
MRARVAMHEAVDSHQYPRTPGLVFQAVNLVAVLGGLLNSHAACVAHRIHKCNGGWLVAPNEAVENAHQRLHQNARKRWSALTLRCLIGLRSSDNAIVWPASAVAGPCWTISNRLQLCQVLYGALPCSFCTLCTKANSFHCASTLRRVLNVKRRSR